MNNNKKRISNFTSSEIWKLMKTGRGEFGFGEKATTYIHEKAIAYKLGRSVNLDGGSRATSWGKFVEGIVFDIVNYEIRSNNKNEPNWIKCLIGIPETNKEGIPTGRKLAREFHGNYQGIVNFISKCELTYGKDAILPITDVEIENRCGYVFKGSTNRLEYID